MAEIDFWLKGTSLVGAIIEILIWLLLVLSVDCVDFCGGDDDGESESVDIAECVDAPQLSAPLQSKPLSRKIGE